MKNMLKNSALLWLLLLAAIATVAFVKAEEPPLTINPALLDDYLQKVRLHTLLLWSEEQARLDVNNKGQLQIWSGMVVWNSGNTVTSDESSLVVIGWGDSNTINGKSISAGIGWGRNNSVWYSKAVIAGWDSNSATWKNAIIVGWDSNKASTWGVVVWGKANWAYDEWAVVVWGNGNKAWKNSLALWQNSETQEGSFWWNGNADANSAYVYASGWTLIGTYTGINGVNLVVAGAVKIEWKPSLTSSPVKWEIRSVNGCIYANDGQGRHVITRTNPSSSCNDAEWLSKSCNWGNTVVWGGDIITGYQYSYAPNASASSCVAKSLVCYDWTFYVKTWANTPDFSKPAGGYYPYCYKIN